MAQIEESGTRPHDSVFVKDPGVLNGHEPAGERNQACAQCNVPIL
jgi:hypothetical protein